MISVFDLAGRLLQVTGRDLRTPGSGSTFEFVFRLPDQVGGDGLAASFEGEKLVMRAPTQADEARTIEIRDADSSRLTPRPRYDLARDGA